MGCGLGIAGKGATGPRGSGQQPSVFSSSTQIIRAEDPGMTYKRTNPNFLGKIHPLSPGLSS